MIRCQPPCGTLSSGRPSAILTFQVEFESKYAILSRHREIQKTCHISRVFPIHLCQARFLLDTPLDRKQYLRLPLVQPPLLVCFCFLPHPLVLSSCRLAASVLCYSAGPSKAWLRMPGERLPLPSMPTQDIGMLLAPVLWQIPRLSKA